MPRSLSTAWRGTDLVVLRDDDEIDRIAADSIERVVLVYSGSGDTPGDLVVALILTTTHVLLLPASSGIGGRVHFERQAYWAGCRCVYWVPQARAPLPRRLRPGHGLFRRQRPAYQRLPREELGDFMADWPLEGPQTWDERKWQRIARARPLAPLEQPPDPHPPRR